MKNYLLIFFFLLACFFQGFAQGRLVTGKVLDPNGNAVPGVTVSVKGSNSSTSTGADGTYRLTVPETATLVFSSVGYNPVEVNASGKNVVDATLSLANSSLGEVVVIGYGSARRKDLTGAVSTVTSKDFNKGVYASPDQLIQGVVAGLEVTNNTGQPGGASKVQIRGNTSLRSGSGPLYVVDGVPLDGRNARPGLNVGGLGQTPDANPLIYLNPNDIASIDVLKDASASAIYGSRGAGGVIMITTRKGQPGITKIDAAASVGISDLMKKPDILSADDYRYALHTFGAFSDSGATVDPFKSITRTPVTQNYTVAFSSGNDIGRYRASFLASNQEGLINKTGLEKYVGSLNGQYKFLDKRLSIDFNFIAAHTKEQIAPISNDAGSNGNMISAALQWNPTLALIENGIYNQHNPNGQFNPLALSDAYDDIASVNTFLGDISAAYKILPDLEYKLILAAPGCKIKLPVVPFYRCS